MDEPTTRRGVRISVPPGTAVGRYVVVDRIGAGGMAELFLARQDGPAGFAKPIALKLLHAHVSEDPEFVRMFQREARVAAALVHPNVVQVLDVGEADGEYFLALEFVHGRDLRRILAACRGPLPLGCAVRVVIDVAKALQHVHTRCDPAGRPLELVHRDVSPANVLVSFGGSVKLADFGIAKTASHTAHTRTGTLKGKFGYMAPEQYLQQRVDPRSDLFALGVVLYEATTGRRAFAGAQTFSIMNRVLAGDWVRPATLVPEYPVELADLIERLLSVRPEARPATAQDVVDALEAFAAASSLDTRVETLAAHVSALFDGPAEPSLDTPVLVSSATSVVGMSVTDGSTISGARRGPRLSRLAALGAIGVVGIVVGAVGGWRMARGDPPSDVATPPAAVVAAPQPVAAAVQSASPPSPPEPIATPSPAAAPRPTSADAPAADARTKARRRSERRPAKPTPAKRDGDLSDMFPKAMQ